MLINFSSTMKIVSESKLKTLATQILETNDKTSQEAYDLLHDDSDVFLPVEAIKHLIFYHTWDGCDNVGPIDASLDPEEIEG